MALDLKNQSYITFDTEEIDYDADKDHATIKMQELFDDLLKNEFVTKEAVKKCLKKMA